MASSSRLALNAELNLRTNGLDSVGRMTMLAKNLLRLQHSKYNYSILKLNKGVLLSTEINNLKIILNQRI